MLPRLAEGPRVSLESTFRKSTSSLSGVVPCCLPFAIADTASDCWETAIHLQHALNWWLHTNNIRTTRGQRATWGWWGAQPRDVQASMGLEALSVEQH